MARLLSVLVVACLGVCWAWFPGGHAASSRDAEKAAYELCAQSEAAINSGSYTKACDLLAKAASYDPTSYSTYVHSNLARCYRQLKEYRKAVAEYELLLKLDPGRSDALYNIALVYYDMGHFDTAVEYLRRYVKVSKDTTWKAHAQRMIAETEVFHSLNEAARCIKADQDQQARRLLERAASHDPSPHSADIHANLAYVLERLGEPERAIEEGKRALSFDAKDKRTMYTIGIAYQDTGRFDDAIAWFKRYLELETDAGERQRVSEFMQDLADDRSKVDANACSVADYLDLLKAAGDARRWPRRKLPIKVHISQGSGISGYRPSFRNFIIRSLDTWCEASGKKLSYVLVDDSKKADMDVIWTVDSLSLNENSRNRLKAGITSVESYDNGEISRAEVRIQTVHAFDRSRALQDGECASTCMHEIGHALGIVGHSTCVSDIMYFSSSSKQSGLPSKRDRSTIARLYSAYPPLQFKPQSSPTESPIKYLPPPAFLPSRPPETETIKPPLFQPPPLPAREQKLSPPLFTPPPVSGGKPAGAPVDSNSMPRPPVFVPPPAKTIPASKAPAALKGTGKPPAAIAPPSATGGRDRKISPSPFFTPPPAR